MSLPNPDSHEEAAPVPPGPASWEAVIAALQAHNAELPRVFTFDKWLACWEIDYRWERRAGFAVVTPDGRLDSIALAARHHGLRQTDAL